MGEGEEVRLSVGGSMRPPPTLPPLLLFGGIICTYKDRAVGTGYRRGKVEKVTQLRRQASDGDVNRLLPTPEHGRQR